MRASNIRLPSLRSAFAVKAWWLLVSRLIPTLVLFFITLIYSRQLSYVEYANFQSSWMYANIISLVISFGLPALMLSTDSNALHSYVKKHVLLVIVFLFVNVVFVGCVLFALENELYGNIKILIFFMGLLQSLNGVIESLCLKRERIFMLLVQNVIYGVLLLAWLGHFIFWPFDLELLLIGLVVLIGLKVFSLVLLQKKPIFSPSNSGVNHIQGQWLYLGLTEVIGLATRWIDKVFILFISTPVAFAVYFNGSIEIPMFSILVSAIGALLTVNIAKHITNTEVVAKQFKETFYLLSAIVFPLFAFFLFSAPDLFHLFFKEKYNASIPIFIASVCMLPVRINNYTVILQCYKQGSEILKGSLLDVCIALILMFPLYKAFGPLGVAVSITLATYFQAAYYLYKSKKILGAKASQLLPLGYLSVSVVMAILVTAAGYFLFQSLPLIWRLMGSITLCIGLIISMLYWHLRKKNENVDARAKGA